MESMVLLKAKLCWEWDDLLYFTKNKRAEVDPLSKEVVSKMERWNALDHQIFEHFNTTLWKEIEATPGFEANLAIFRVKLGKSHHK